MRIRHYVFDYLAQTTGSVTRIPSNRELAERFNVSQPTVVRALQELIKEGYLIHRPGVGLFSNPGRFDARESKIWGIIFGDGRWAYLARDAFYAASVIGGALLKKDNNHLLKLITMGETSRDNFPELGNLSGIVWWGPEAKVIPDLRRIAETIPVVVISGQVPGIDCYYYDFEAENYETARQLISRGCRKLALVRSHYIPEAVAGIERACGEAGIAFSEEFILGNDLADEHKLEQLVAEGKAPDGIIFNCKAVGFQQAIERIPELADALIASANHWIDENWKFNGIVVSTSFEDIAGEIVRLLAMKPDAMPRIFHRLKVYHTPVSKP